MAVCCTEATELIRLDPRTDSTWSWSTFLRARISAHQLVPFYSGKKSNSHERPFHVRVEVLLILSVHSTIKNDPVFTLRQTENRSNTNATSSRDLKLKTKPFKKLMGGNKIDYREAQRGHCSALFYRPEFAAVHLSESQLRRRQVFQMSHPAQNIYYMQHLWFTVISLLKKERPTSIKIWIKGLIIMFTVPLQYIHYLSR